MLLVTPRDLVRRYFPHAQLDQAYLDLSVEAVLKGEWAISYHPSAEEPYRSIAMTKPREHLALLINKTYFASRTAGRPELPPR